MEQLRKKKVKQTPKAKCKNNNTMLIVWNDLDKSSKNGLKLLLLSSHA